MDRQLADPLASRLNISRTKSITGLALSLTAAAASMTDFIAEHDRKTKQKVVDDYSARLTAMKWRPFEDVYRAIGTGKPLPGGTNPCKHAIPQ